MQTSREANRTPERERFLDTRKLLTLFTFVMVPTFCSAVIEIVNPLNGALFPADMTPPVVRWEDNSISDRWILELDLGDGEPAQVFACERPRWQPTLDHWKVIAARAQRQSVQVHVRAAEAGAASDEVTVSFRVSSDPVAAPILYREVPLPLSVALANKPAIRWRLGWVDSPQPPPVILEGLTTCANCHSTSADGRTLAMDLDYGNDKGSYLITTINKETRVTTSDLITWSDFRRDENHRTLGLLSRISPDGRWALSTVQEWSIQRGLPEPDVPQLFFPVRGIIAMYDRSRAMFRPLAGADDPEVVQTNPEWSPDGRFVTFARAKALPLEQLEPRGRVPKAVSDRFVNGDENFCFDLYRLPFNNGQGGAAIPVKGASGNGRSNYFPRYSPDGKWLVFCQAPSFMLNQLDSALYIVPSEGGEARRLRCNFDGRMNSWHSFSPNGRWLVFSSKVNGPFTKLWLTHLDDDGRSSVPVLLDGFTAPDRAANLPEFVNLEPGQLQRISIELARGSGVESRVTD